MLPCPPLGEVIGMITLNNPSGDFSFEDSDLLQTIADQTAILILNLKLFEGLGRAREIQAFQSLSAFLVHDLKNVATTLSLTLENFPLHYENAEFRADALKMISQSLDKIRNMCSKMSEADFELKVERQDTDLNEIILGVVAKLNANGIISTNLGDLPEVALDAEQIKKVVLNLVLNSIESIGKEGKILHRDPSG